MLFDIIAAIFISIYLLYNAYTLAKEAIDLITDKELPEEIKSNIQRIIKEEKDVLGVHDFRSRNLGDMFYFEMHLEIDGNITLYEAHKIADNVEQKILMLYPNSQIIIHQDPFGIKENRLDHEINGICEIKNTQIP